MDRGPHTRSTATKWPNNQWVHRMQQDIGLLRQTDLHGTLRWLLAGEGQINAPSEPTETPVRSRPRSKRAISCVDWEMMEAWRRWRDKYLFGWEAKFRQRFETEMIEKNDTHFFVGTVHQHPNAWMIVGLFYPPKTPQVDLFGLA